MGKILDQMLPAPDEAPLTSCPHCGAEYNVQDEESDEHYDIIVEVIPGCIALYRHIDCGGLVHFVGIGADMEDNCSICAYEENCRLTSDLVRWCKIFAYKDMPK